MTDRELMQQALEAKQTSLIELLEAVPVDARLVVDDGPHSTSFYPVGRMCHGAAAALRERLAQPEQEKFSCGVDFADGLLTVSVVRGHADGSMEVIHTEQIALAQPTVKDSLTPHPSIIEDIADNLLQDHVELMAENKQLRESLQEILYENYAPEHYTDETIDYEMGQGNMMMPAVKRAYALVGRGRS